MSSESGLQTGAKDHGAPASRYADVDVRKSEGVTYTPPSLARFVAREIVGLLRSWSRERSLRVLDPAAGEGSLARALLDELSGGGFTSVSFLGLDTDPSALEVAEASTSDRYRKYDVRFEVEDFLRQRFPPTPGDRIRDSRPFDLIIANPPYVRTQVLGGRDARALAERFSLKGRVDLCFAFLLTITDVLSPDGVAGIIVSNRFMTTKAGKSIREFIPERIHIHSLWDLGDSKLFNATVLPAVILGTGFDHPSSANIASARFTSLYLTSESPRVHARDPVDALQHEGVVELDDGRRFQVQRGLLDTGPRRGDVWRVTTDEIRDWLESVDRATWCNFGDLGKIRVGVKTTADRVFIREDWCVCDGKEPELLRPLITHHVAHRYRASSPIKRILYPHITQGGRCVPVDLSRYPRAAMYLERHKTTLKARPYLSRVGRRWYEVWVPQDPSAWEKPKLVFRDIAERPVFWMDTSGAIVNGDCYWLAPSETTKIGHIWLALAVANSMFCEVYYDRRFNNKLFAGRRRFMTQYVEHFPVPDPTTKLAQRAVQLAKTLFERELDNRTAFEMQDEVDRLVWHMFGCR